MISSVNDLFIAFTGLINEFPLVSEFPEFYLTFNFQTNQQLFLLSFMFVAV